MLLVQTLLIMDESLHRFFFKSISFRVSAITTPLMQQSNNNSTFLIIIVFFVCTNLEKTSISCSSKSVTKTRKSVTICLLRLPQSSCDKDSYLRNIIETYLQPYFLQSVEFLCQFLLLYEKAGLFLSGYNILLCSEHIHQFKC